MGRGCAEVFEEGHWGGVLTAPSPTAQALTSSDEKTYVGGWHPAISEF